MSLSSILCQENEREELFFLPTENVLQLLETNVRQRALPGWSMRTTERFGGKASLAAAGDDPARCS